MIGESKEFEDVGRVASSFRIYLGKTKVALLAEYIEGGFFVRKIDRIRSDIDAVASSQACAMRYLLIR